MIPTPNSELPTPLSAHCPLPTAHSGRVHIYWQKRIVAGDVTTPWWFPSQTSSGSIREDRVVLPIPPGVRWSDEMPRVLPGEDVEGGEVSGRKKGGDVGSGAVGKRRIASSTSPHPHAPHPNSRSAPPPSAHCPLPTAHSPITDSFAGSKLFFAPPPAPPAPKVEKKREPKKNNPKLVAAARELRDRWLERVNAGEALPAPEAKYDVARRIERGSGESMRIEGREPPLLVA